MLIAMWVSCWAICQNKLSWWFLQNKYLPTFSYQCLLKYQSPLRSVQRHRPRPSSPLLSLPVSVGFLLFPPHINCFYSQLRDTMSAKWRVMDGIPRVFQVSKHPSWRVVSNSIIFDWHVFTTSIFLYINGLLITLNLLAVMQMLIGINIKHQTDTISTEQTQSVYILWEL